jgi:hypothetical protein
MNDMPDMSGADANAGGLGDQGDAGQAPDLKTAVKQLQDTIAGLSAQVEQVAEAAGLPPSGEEGSPAEEAGETPEAEGAEDQGASTPDQGDQAAAGEAGAPAEPAKGAFDNFLSKRPKAAM